MHGYVRILACTIVFRSGNAGLKRLLGEAELVTDARKRRGVRSVAPRHARGYRPRGVILAAECATATGPRPAPQDRVRETPLQ